MFYTESKQSSPAHLSLRLHIFSFSPSPLSPTSPAPHPRASQILRRSSPEVRGRVRSVGSRDRVSRDRRSSDPPGPMSTFLPEPPKVSPTPHPPPPPPSPLPPTSAFCPGVSWFPSPGLTASDVLGPSQPALRHEARLA